MKKLLILLVLLSSFGTKAFAIDRATSIYLHDSVRSLRDNVEFICSKENVLSETELLARLEIQRTAMKSVLSTCEGMGQIKGYCDQEINTIIQQLQLEASKGSISLEVSVIISEILHSNDSPEDKQASEGNGVER